MLVKQKRNLEYNLITIKVHTGPIGKRQMSQKGFHEFCGQCSHNRTDNWQFTLIEQCETQDQLKEREEFWQNRFKKIKTGLRA